MERMNSVKTEIHPQSHIPRIDLQGMKVLITGLWLWQAVAQARYGHTDQPPVAHAGRVSLASLPVIPSFPETFPEPLLGSCTSPHLILQLREAGPVVTVTPIL